MSTPKALQRWREAEQRLQAGDTTGAAEGFAGLVDDPMLGPVAHLRLSLIATEQGRWRDSIEQALAGFGKRVPDPDLLAMLAKRLATMGEMRAALDCALDPAMLQQGDGPTLADTGRLLSDASCPIEARKLLELARQRGEDTPATRYLLGLNRMYCDGGEAATPELEAVASDQPDMAVALWALSKARPGVEGFERRVERIRAAIARRAPGADDLPLLQYALFNEIDRDGDPDEAWAALEAGMRARRAQVEYDAGAEEQLFRYLGELEAEARPDDGRRDGPRPVFIVGMPRSGTTLLERVLGNHPDIADAGELHDLVWQMRWCADLRGSKYLDLALAKRAEQFDFAELGRRYLEHSAWRARGKPVYTDKMPANFFNIPYIVRALPQARILHMVRGPMDTCFSNLKELFAGAYPHTYDQEEMAAHFRNYRALMARWKVKYPDRILDVRYDELVREPERVAREVVEFCGLPWVEGMSDIQKRGGAVATASAAQVREPIHARFLNQWRRYETHLGPLRKALGTLGY